MFASSVLGAGGGDGTILSRRGENFGGTARDRVIDTLSWIGEHGGVVTRGIVEGGGGLESDSVTPAPWLNLVSLGMTLGIFFCALQTTNSD